MGSLSQNAIRGSVITSTFQERTNFYSNNRVVPPSVLLIGKKHAVNYIAPGLFRLNSTGELIIKATGSLSIVTAVDVAEIIKRDVENVITKTISLGTDSLIVSTGETRRMSCIEIKLSKFVPTPEPAIPVENVAPAPVPEAPVVAAKKTRTRKKAAAGKKRKTAKKKK